MHRRKHQVALVFPFWLMSYFPQLRATGMRVQYPARSIQMHLTRLGSQESGPRFATALRAAPLSRWQLQYAQLTTAELATLTTFFDEQKGRYGEWTWLDPAGNLCPYSDDFTHASWERYGATPGATAADPFGGNRGVTVTGSTNGMLATIVLPDGNGAGIVLCGSVWVYAAAPQSLHIGFIDSAFSVIASRTWSLRAGWQRIFCGVTLATSSYVRLLIGGLNTWGGATLRLFGARCAPLAGPGEYVRSPGNYGLHRARFDSDSIAVTYTGPGLFSASVDVASD
jgi:hypothetical protein